jgi:competence protein ComEC
MRGRLSPSGWWFRWGRVQWVIGIGLIPMTIALFQQCSLISFFANSIAIPWLSFFILPFCLLGGIFLLLSPYWGQLFLNSADYSLSLLWKILTFMSSFQYASWNIVIPNYYLLILMMIGFILFILPVGFPGKWLGIILILPVICYKPAEPQTGDFWLTVLDVGQGLSVLVQTKHHVLVYDAGSRLANHFDMGESIVKPYLHTQYIHHIDKLIVSHGDNDHIGGANTLINSFSIDEIKTSVPQKLMGVNAKYCLADENWQWDHVNFLFLYPTNETLHLGNDSSCVLRIDNGEHSVLLTGDIEKYAEKNLLSRLPKLLKSDILIAPHHGSKTSGLLDFILAVKPKIVLYATGYKNRYHLPHQNVIENYKAIQSIAFNTVDSGSIQFKIKMGESLPMPEQYRINSKRYWHDERLSFTLSD